jgi:hypothetical protein
MPHQRCLAVCHIWKEIMMFNSIDAAKAYQEQLLGDAKAEPLAGPARRQTRTPIPKPDRPGLGTLITALLLSAGSGR